MFLRVGEREKMVAAVMERIMSDFVNHSSK